MTNESAFFSSSFRSFSWLHFPCGSSAAEQSPDRASNTQTAGDERRARRYYAQAKKLLTPALLAAHIATEEAILKLEGGCPGIGCKIDLSAIRANLWKNANDHLLDLHQMQMGTLSFAEVRENIGARQHRLDTLLDEAFQKHFTLK